MKKRMNIIVSRYDNECGYIETPKPITIDIENVAMEIEKALNDILNSYENDADPIILFKTKHGRLILTAWGDEANDELVANQNLN